MYNTLDGWMDGCYLALIGKSPYSGCNLNCKYDKQEEKKLHKEKTKLNSVACVHV